MKNELMCPHCGCQDIVMLVAGWFPLNKDWTETTLDEVQHHAIDDVQLQKLIEHRFDCERCEQGFDEPMVYSQERYDRLNAMYWDD